MSPTTTAAKPHQPMHRRHRGKDALREMKLLLAIEGIEVVEQHRFLPRRRYRFHFAIPGKKIAIQYQSPANTKSEKYKLANSEGWKVLSYSVFTYRKVIEEVKGLLNYKDCAKY